MDVSTRLGVRRMIEKDLHGWYRVLLEGVTGEGVGVKLRSWGWELPTSVASSPASPSAARAIST